MMNLDFKPKKDKELINELEIRVKDIHIQLFEQLKCLDNRAETHEAMLLELQEFCKLKAAAELEYSQRLDRIVKQTMSRHKTDKQRRENWPGYSTYACWQSLLKSTMRQSKDHLTLSEIYSQRMTLRFASLSEDMHRIYHKCKDVVLASHSEISKVLGELQNSLKTYHLYHAESQQSENKLRQVETQKSKLEHTSSIKGTSRKYKSYEKQKKKKQLKYQENKQKALKARNDYLLSLDSANACLSQYYTEDLPNIIDCMDFGYHNTLSRAMLTHQYAETAMGEAQDACTELTKKCIAGICQQADKQSLMDDNIAIFRAPHNFDFQPHKGDEVCQISAQKLIQEELIDRANTLSKRVEEIKFEQPELFKTLQTTDETLMDMINVADYDVKSLFSNDSNSIAPRSPHERAKLKADRSELESFYLEKFAQQIAKNNLLARVQSKLTSIQKALGDGDLDDIQNSLPPSLPPKPPMKICIGKAPRLGEAKLFGGTIQDYVDTTGEQIPIVIRSTIQVINLHGMHHHGVFRVSGSQHEINEFKNSFEKREEPLLDRIESRDINSVAGVLKLYFRELKVPLFGTTQFDKYIECSQIKSQGEMISKIKELLGTLSETVLLVMAYLFSFLHHVTEYSDENMMDAYNLAICFGPTLLPIPADRNQVQYQAYVNEFVKNVILYHEEIFSSTVNQYQRISDNSNNEGNLSVIYERCIVGGQEELLRNLSEEDEDCLSDLGETTSDEEMELHDAVALYDFNGRTHREITFKKGAVLAVSTRISADWFEGHYDGRDGLVPAKYICLKSQSTLDKSRTKSVDGLDCGSSQHSGAGVGSSSTLPVQSSLPQQPRQPSPFSGHSGDRIILPLNIASNHHRPTSRDSPSPLTAAHSVSLPSTPVTADVHTIDPSTTAAPSSITSSSSATTSTRLGKERLASSGDSVSAERGGGGGDATSLDRSKGFLVKRVQPPSQVNNTATSSSVTSSPSGVQPTSLASSMERVPVFALPPPKLLCDSSKPVGHAPPTMQPLKPFPKVTGGPSPLRRSASPDPHSATGVTRSKNLSTAAAPTSTPSSSSSHIIKPLPSTPAPPNFVAPAPSNAYLRSLPANASSSPSSYSSSITNATATTTSDAGGGSSNGSSTITTMAAKSQFRGTTGSNSIVAVPSPVCPAPAPSIPASGTPAAHNTTTPALTAPSPRDARSNSPGSAAEISKDIDNVLAGMMSGLQSMQREHSVELSPLNDEHEDDLEIYEKPVKSTNTFGVKGIAHITPDLVRGLPSNENTSCAEAFANDDYDTMRKPNASAISSTKPAASATATAPAHPGRLVGNRISPFEAEDHNKPIVKSKPPLFRKPISTTKSTTK